MLSVIRSRIFVAMRVRLAAERMKKVTDIENSSAPADRSTDGAVVASSLQNDLLQMAEDPDSGVRFQLALAIGQVQ